MIVRKIPKENRIKRKSLYCPDFLLLKALFLIVIKIKKLTQKKPQSTNSIQKGDIWQLPASKINGPIFPISVKNLGEQFTPIPDTNGLKNQEKGSEKTIKEAIRIIVFVKNLKEIPKRK